jgi:quercetin dioxygenase-like cupin family protein
VTRTLFLAFLLSLSGGTVSAQVEIDNNWVRVLRVKQAAHEKSPMRQQPASVVVYLTDCHQRLTNANGKVQDLAKKAGNVAYFSPVKQSEENVSDQPMEAVAIELKPDAPKTKSQPITLDPVKLDPEHHIVLLENGRVRVMRTILEPHLKAPMHEHPHYVVVYLTELHTTMTMADGKNVDNVRKPGEVAWRDRLQHATENVGERTAMEIQVELK